MSSFIIEGGHPLSGTITPQGAKNEALQRRLKEVQDLRDKGLPSIPTTLALEKETNVFLRAGSAERFAELRALKDRS